VNLSGETHWCRGPLEESKTRLIWGPITLFTITLDTGSDNVLPVLASTPSYRDDMVICQFCCMELASTVLTTVMVTHKKIMARKLYLSVLAADLYVVE
jgi:hypothetical protein